MRANRRLPARALALATLAVLAAPVGARSLPKVPAGYQAVKTAQLHKGVEYVKLAKAAGPVVAHVAHIEPSAPVDLKVVTAHDRVPTSTGDLETTSSMCRRVRCIAGVNGDFHKFGVPAGAVIIDGRMLRSPDPDRPQLTVTKDGRLVAGTLAWSGALTGPGGQQTPVATVNAHPPAGKLAVFTSEYGKATPASGRTELVVKGSGIATLNRSTNLELVNLRTGAGPIPDGGAVLSADGAAAQALRELWEKRKAGGPVRLEIRSPLDANVSLGVEPVVLQDGKKATPWRDPNVINPTQPHTFIGWNKEGHVYLVAVDGRQPASEGLNMAQSADFLSSLGVTDAVSLDGGGGTVFVADGAVWNRPSDNDPARPGNFVERGAPNAFVIVARPEAPAAQAPVGSRTPKPITPMTAPTAGAPGGKDDEGVLPPVADEPLVSIPLSPGPLTLNGEALVAPTPEEADEGDATTGPEPAAQSARSPVPPPGPGREAPAPPAEAPAGPPPTGQPATTGTATPPEESDDASPTDDQDTVAAPATRSDEGTGSSGAGRSPLTTMLAGTALATVTGVMARRRRARRRPSAPQRPGTIPAQASDRGREATEKWPIPAPDGAAPTPEPVPATSAGPAKTVEAAPTAEPVKAGRRPTPAARRTSPMVDPQALAKSAKAMAELARAHAARIEAAKEPPEAPAAAASVEPAQPADAPAGQAPVFHCTQLDGLHPLAVDPRAMRSPRRPTPKPARRPTDGSPVATGTKAKR